MPDKFEDLSTYLAVLASGGVNAAAADLGIAKSAVSRRLSDLERRLGVSLIDRTSRRFEPTAVGLEYARRARVLLASLDDLDASVTSNDDRGSVTIRADRAITVHRLIPALAAMGDGSRSLTIRLLDEADATIDDRWDVRIGVGGGEDGARTLFSTEEVLCAAPGYLQQNGVPASGLAGHRTIGIGEDRSRPCDIQTPDADAAAAAAVAGLGIARLPDYVVDAAIADGTLVRLTDARGSGPVTVFAWCREDAGAAARRLVDALAAAFG